MLRNISLFMMTSAALAGAGVLWWPAAALLAPAYFYVLLFHIFVPAPGWLKVETLKPGSAKWTPCGGDVVWPGPEWHARCGRGAWHRMRLPADPGTITGFARARFMEFKTTFDVSPFAPGSRVFLGIPGAGGRVTAWVDGKPAVRGAYGFLPLEIEIGELLDGKNNKHELRIRVDRGGDLRVVRDMSLGPAFAVGVFRDVYIQARKPVFIRNIALVSEPGLEAPIVRVWLDGRAAGPVAVSGVIKDADGAELFPFEMNIAKLDSAAAVSAAVDADAIKPWSRFHPALYTVRATASCDGASDTLERRAGYRAMSLTPRGVVVNGQLKKLVGARRAEHFPPYGAAFPGWAMKRDIELAADACINLLWSAHFPMHPAFLDACDEQGMYVAQDMPAADALACADSVPEALERLNTVMRDAAAHPCFLFWYMDRIGRRVSEQDRALIVDFARRAVSRGRLVLSPGAADALGIEQHGPAVIEKTIDVCNPGGLTQAFSQTKKGESAIYILDMLDGQGGADGRHAREMRKAAVDQHILKVTDNDATAGLVLGHLFGWGLRMGVMSVTRKKKVSADVLHNYLKNKVTGGISVPPAVSGWTYRLPALILFALFAGLMAIQPGARFLFADPALVPLFSPLPMLIAVRESALLMTAACIAYYLNQNPAVHFALAPRLPFPAFMRLSASWLYRALTVAGALAWLQALGVCALLWSGAGAESIAGALAVGALADAALLALLFTDCAAAPAILAAALLQAVLLSEFLPPALAAAFPAIAYVPAAAAMAWLGKIGRYA